MKKINIKFQIDEIVLVLIVAVLGIIVSVHDSNKEPMGKDAEKITEMILDNHDISFASGGVVNENRLEEIKSMKYADFKNLLNIKNDFCVYIEDENGNIILSKGSTKLNGDGIFCKE